MATSNFGYENTDLSAVQPWVEWQHIPMGRTHCPTCLQLDKCWFPKANMPTLPQHERCHCTVVSKSVITVQQQAKAESAYTKYDPYLFNTNGAYCHGKEVMFKKWGYTASDALWLKKEIEKQGLKKYIEGNYVLNKLDKNGQRINIVVSIPRKSGEGIVTFTTGWVVYPNGHISLVTPYGGK